MSHLFFLKDGEKGNKEAGEKTEGNKRQVGGKNLVFELENRINVWQIFNLIMIFTAFLQGLLCAAILKACASYLLRALPWLQPSPTNTPLS